MSRFPRLLMLSTLLALVITRFANVGGNHLPHWVLLGWLALVGVVYGFWYGRRFGATYRQCLPAVLFLASMPCLLWLLPVLVFPDSDVVLLLGQIAATVQMVISLAVLSFVGHYSFTRRAVPELTGRPREVVEEALRRAGVRPFTILVAPLQHFNAAVVGVGRCAVLVDKRATESLDDAQLQALIGHECGHARTGGLIPYLATVPAAGLILQGVAGWSQAAPSVWEGMALWLLMFFLVSQVLEFTCDRFASRVFSPAAMTDMLTRIHDDYPVATRRILSRQVFSPVGTHPPLAVRTAALLPQRGANVGYVFWWTMALLLVGSPLALRVVLGPADSWGSTSAFLPWLTSIGPLAYIAWCFCFAIAVRFSLRRSNPATQDTRPRSRAYPVIATLLGLSTLILLLMAAQREPTAGAPLGIAALLTLFTFLAFLLFGVFTGQFRRGTLTALPARVRAPVLAASAALQEDHPREALEIIGQVRPDDAASPWVVQVRAASHIMLGQFDTAAVELDEMLVAHPGFVAALGNRILAAVGRSETERIHQLTAQLHASRHRLGQVHYLCGLGHLEVGEYPQAVASFREARALKPADGPALAGEVIARLLADDPPGEVETLLTEAERLEPRYPLIQLARAIWAHHQSDSGAAQAALSLVRATLEKREWHGMAIVYTRWAERCGLT